MLVRLLGRLVGGTMLLASASAAGVPGKDFFYYYGNNSAAPRAEGVGATLSTWHQTSPSVPTDAIAFGPPTITKITLPPGGSWPGVGQSYHLSEDAYYVVVAGEARLPGLDNGTTFKSGDWMWGMAGVTHGPVTAASGSAANLTILAVGTALDARVGGAPVNFSNPTVDQDRSHARRRACQYRDGGLGCDYSGPHTADRVTWGAGGQAPCADSPGHPEGSCLQPHYHPRGALYIGLTGRTFYGQDYEGFDAWIDQGDVRWTRPGHWYGPEYTNEGCEILAMHPSHGGSGDHLDTNGSWVGWVKPPPGPYVAQYVVTTTHVYE
jgi:hypothetical protein